MHIAFDAKRAFANATGLGQYSRTLLTGLARTFPGHRYGLFAPRVPRAHALLRLPGVEAHAPQGWWHPGWRQRGMGADAARAGAQVFHGLSHELPTDCALPSAVTMHDAIFMRYPALYPWADRQVYRAKWAHALRHATQVVAISEQTRADLQAFFPLRRPEDILVIPPGIDPRFYVPPTPEAVQAIRQIYRLPAQYVLVVGSIAPRKNTLNLLHAMRLLPEVPLVLVGTGRGGYMSDVLNLAKKMHPRHALKFLLQVPSSDLPLLYAGAIASVYPSVFEGFGLPIVESLATGTPVVTSTGGCFAEAGGDAALYADPASPEAIAAALREVVYNSALRQILARRGLRQAARFRPEVIAGRWIAVYRALAQDAA